MSVTIGMLVIITIMVVEVILMIAVMISIKMMVIIVTRYSTDAILHNLMPDAPQSIIRGSV